MKATTSHVRRWVGHDRGSGLALRDVAMQVFHDDVHSSAAACRLQRHARVVINAEVQSAKVLQRRAIDCLRMCHCE